MCDKQVNGETKKTIDEEVQKSYHNIIRQMIKDENEIRNQRTNWFLVIQGFLVTGCCELYANKCQCNIYDLILIISPIGIVSSLSLVYASWRSEKSIQMLLAVWDIFIIDCNKKYKNFPPVVALTHGIINRYKNKEQLTDNDYRELEIFNKMYNKKSKTKCSLEFILNKCDFMLPFRSIPVIFIIAWIAVFFIILKDLPCK